MEKSEEVTKERHSRGLIKLNKKKQNVGYDYKEPQQQNKSPVSFYEEDFPSLSEVGLKNSPSDKVLPSHENSLSYSARLKILPQKERSKNAKFCTGQSSNLPSSHASYSTYSPSKKKKYTSEAIQFPKSEKFTDKSIVKNTEYSEQTSNFSFHDLTNNIQKSLLPSNCHKVSKEEIEDEGEWTVVKGKSLSDRNILKDSGQVKYKKIKTDKNNSNVQSSFRSSNFTHQECSDQNVNINMTKKWGNVRDNFNSQKFSNANNRTEFNIVKDPHSQSIRKKHLFLEKAQDPHKIVNSRSNQLHKGHIASNVSLESKNKVPVHVNHNVENLSLKDAKNFSNFMQSCKVESSQFSDNENFSNKKPQRNFNKKSVVEKEHSEVKFDTSIKMYQKNSLKRNSEQSQGNKNAQLQSKASSSSSYTNEVMQLKSHELRNKDGGNKNACISNNAQNCYFTVSNNQTNISNKGNQLNKMQAENSLVPSRKKRKSKIKRQAAMQSDKIRLITPETFSKILSQKNNEGIRLQNTSSVNINDCEEYPELGAASATKCNLESRFKNIETNLKRENVVLSETCDPKIRESHALSMKEGLSEERSCPPSDIVIKINESNQSECEPDDEEKVPVHCNDPITISIFDMLQVNKNKRKESEKGCDASKISPSKVNSKKLVSSENRYFVNPLDSSKPAVKRGKERENPKPKKISQLKKIILMDRRKRKESKKEMLMTNENPSSADNDDLLKYDSSFSNFNKYVINEINFELLNHSNNFHKESITSLEMSTSEVNDYMQECVQNDDSKETNNFSLILVPSKVDNIGMESCESSDSCLTQTNNSASKLNVDVKTVDSDTSKISSNCIDIDADNIPSNVENNSKSDLVTDSLDNLHLIKNCKHLMNKYSKESNIPNIETNYIQCIEQQNVENDNVLTDIRLLFNRENKSIFIKENKLRKYNYEHTLSDIRYLFKYLNSGETFFKDEDTSALNDIRYLFERENFNPFLGENISKIPSTPLNEDILQDINDICSLKENFDANQKNIIEMTKLDENICSLDIPLCRDQNPAIHRRYSEQEILEASLALLHSKKFRSYCTHFLSKELEEAVFVLLDDLARFQDRMHQKDPVKARMKRRLLYGMREIKRHMKLKKLKCIIIASDIEDSKTEGGLNDILNDLKSLAKDYQIPCIFSHLRKKLGYICHKSAPVSAVGVFNFEGSEVNFKKMLEIQNECKLDYEEVVTVVSSKLTDEQISLIYRTIKTDMSTFHSVVTGILKEYFPNPASKNMEGTSMAKSMENKSLIKGTKFNSDNKNRSITDEIICTDKEISSNIIEVESKTTIEDLKVMEEASKIYNILEKYKFINY